MSKTEIAIADETFASKLGIDMVSTQTFEELIEMHAGTRIVICAVGASGIGKTAIPKQVARRRAHGEGVPYVCTSRP
jgi:2-phosphoglycerate kinase